MDGGGPAEATSFASQLIDTTSVSTGRAGGNDRADFSFVLLKTPSRSLRLMLPLIITCPGSRVTSYMRFLPRHCLTFLSFPYFQVGSSWKLHPVLYLKMVRVHLKVFQPEAALADLNNL